MATREQKELLGSPESTAAASGSSHSHSHSSSQQQQQQQGQNDDDVEIVSEYDAFPHAEECTAVLTMKCGEPLMAVRKKLHDEITISFVPEEGFGVFQSKVERHYSKIGPGYVQEKRAIYLKPSSNATQTKYVQLTKENFDPLLRMRWKIARSMKVELKYEIFCYFVDTTATTKKEKKRLSLKMFSEPPQQQQPELNGGGSASAAAFLNTAPITTNSIMSAAAVHGFPLLSAQSASQAMQTYVDLNASMIDASLPVAMGRKVVSSSNKRSHDSISGGNGSQANGGRDESASDRPRKLTRVNSRNTTGAGAASATGVAEQLAADLHEEPFFQAIPFRINGFVVPLEVDITALRRALGIDSNSNSSSNSSMADASTAPATDMDAQQQQQQQQQYDR